MRDLQYYIKLFSPKKRDQAMLLYGVQYHLWLEGTYLGTAVWTEDEVLGDSFQNQVMMNGELLQVIYIADTWALITRKQIQRPTN